MAESYSRKVSFDDELLILVNENDEQVGFKDKADCHRDGGVLHRAFSIFVFNDQGHLLIQKRSEQKTLWPLYWSNSCCSHPRKGERIEIAALRRLREELGINADLKFLFKFQYQASYGDVGAEHELCSVFIGKSNGPIYTNDNEIAEWQFVEISRLEEWFSESPNSYTPWFKTEWERIRKDYWDEIQALLT
jgi:isopentenyl-diphosphate delta-isomerase